MTKLKVLGNVLSIAIAPGTKKGMYLRNISGVSFHSARQMAIQARLARIAMGMRGRTPREIRAAVAGQLGESMETRRSKYQARLRANHAVTDAKWGGGRVPAAAAEALPGLY